MDIFLTTDEALDFTRENDTITQETCPPSFNEELFSIAGIVPDASLKTKEQLAPIATVGRARRSLTSDTVSDREIAAQESSNTLTLSNLTPKIAASGRPLKVLVADDNLLIRTSLLNLLEKWEIKYCICDNGQTAWQYLQEEIFDLVLIDLQMPLMDGHEVVACVRADDDGLNQQVPIIAMAGSTDEKSKAQMMIAGASLFVSKPLDPKVLFQIITELNIIPEHQQVRLYTDVIDQQLLRELYDNDSAHLMVMLDLFLKNTPPALTAMEIAANHQNWEELEKAIHKIKPTFAMVGLQKVGELAETLELMLSSQSTIARNKINADFRKFRKAVNQAVHIISEQHKSIQDFVK
jgi:CheY-like chemotaxis protein